MVAGQALVVVSVVTTTRLNIVEIWWETLYHIPN